MNIGILWFRLLFVLVFVYRFSLLLVVCVGLSTGWWGVMLLGGDRCSEGMIWVVVLSMPEICVFFQGARFAWGLGGCFLEDLGGLMRGLWGFSRRSRLGMSSKLV